MLKPNDFSPGPLKKVIVFGVLRPLPIICNKCLVFDTVNDLIYSSKLFSCLLDYWISPSLIDARMTSAISSSRIVSLATGSDGLWCIRAAAGGAREEPAPADVDAEAGEDEALT